MRLGSRWGEGDPGGAHGVRVACRVGPCGIWAGPLSSHPPHPSSGGGGGGGRVTELPSYRRIRKLLTGEAAANQRAASLFSGRRPGDAPSPDTQRSTLPHNHSGSHTLSQGHAASPHTHTITVTHTVSYAVPGTRRDTQHHTNTQNLGDTDVVPGHTALPRPTVTMTHSITLTHNHNDTQCRPDPCNLHDLIPKTHNISDTS